LKSYSCSFYEMPIPESLTEIAMVLSYPVTTPF
jgi:hypothetical protein